MAKSIEDFAGRFRSAGGDNNISNASKAGYYPREDVVFEFFVEAHASHRDTDPVARSVIRAQVIQGTNWLGRVNFERARFYFHGGILVSDPITTDVPDQNGGVNLRFTEAVLLQEGGTMEHQLMWSDGDFGRWGCGPD